MYRIGIDLGGTNIATGVINEKMEIVGFGKLKTNAPRNADLIFDDIASTVHTACEDAGISLNEVKCIGMGTPGTVNQSTGMIEFSNNLDFKNINARKMLEERLQKVSYIENDANCAALGEALAGVGKDVCNFVAITLGTGVGSGIVLDGKIYSGSNFAAGEFGHTVINVDGEQCTCGRRGCWERYASATALINQTKNEMRHAHDSVMWQLVNENINFVSGKTSFDAMRQGDEAAKRVVDRYIYYVAVGLINVINILQPEMICMGGGISREGDALLKPLQRHIERERYSVYASIQTQLQRGILGNEAGIIGAALLDK